MRFRHVILDRDGVLNREAVAAGYILRPEDFHWLPGALDALALLRASGVRLSVATNQSAVGRGLMDGSQLEAIHARMCAEAAASGGALDAVFYCPHGPHAKCDCRKPAPGLIHAAMDATNIPGANTLVVGDDMRDLEAAMRASISGALVRTGKGIGTEARARDMHVTVPVYDDLLQLARAIVVDTN